MREPTAALTLLLALAAALALTLGRAERQPPVTTVLDRLTDTTAQIRVRLSVLLLVGLAAAADRLGFEAILGAFLAGAVLRLIDKPADGGRPQLQVKLSGIGYGFLVPVFFVYSGVTFDIQSLLRHPVTLARVPVFLLALPWCGACFRRWCTAGRSGPGRRPVRACFNPSPCR